MKTGLDELRSRLDALAVELDVAKERIRDLERRRKHLFFRQLVVIICASVAAAAISSWAQTPKQPPKPKQPPPKPAPQIAPSEKVTRFSAPFEIVDSTGSVIMRVADSLPAGTTLTAVAVSRGIYLYNKGGFNSAAIGAHGTGGLVEVKEEGKRVEMLAWKGVAAVRAQDYDKSTGGAQISSDATELQAPMIVWNSSHHIVFMTNDSKD